MKDFPTAISFAFAFIKGNILECMCYYATAAIGLVLLSFAIITVEVLDRHSVIERGVMENNILNL